ncbi:MAG: hypothetical protein AMXMBFR49_29960 [Chlorobiota bacterium]
MKNRVLLYAVLLSGLLSPAFAADSLTILFVNDTHSNLAPQGPRNPDLSGTVGGIARAASVIGNFKLTRPNVITLHGGDMCIGDPMFSGFLAVPELQLLKAIGFDAAAVGNHEFDTGSDVLLMELQAAFPNGSALPLISSNLILPTDTLQGLANYIFETKIIQFGNLKVGIFGLTTPSAKYLSNPGPVGIIEDQPELATKIGQTVAYLRGELCSYVICLSHMGIGLDQMIFSMIPGVDLVISSHDHIVTPAPVEVLEPQMNWTTRIVQAGAFYHNVGKVTVPLNLLGLPEGPLSWELIPLNTTIPEEPTVKTSVDTLSAQLERQYSIPFFSTQCGTAAGIFSEVAPDLRLPGAHDTPIGNLVTDAFANQTGVPLAITLGGLTAQPIMNGPIVPADIHRAIGYGGNEVDNLGYRLIKLSMTGLSLWTAFESVLQMSDLDDEFLPQVSGMTYSFEMVDTPAYRMRSITINGQPLDPGAIYSIVTNEFVAMAMAQLFEIPYSVDTLYSDLTEFRALLQYVMGQGTITPLVTGRVTDVNDRNTGQLPQGFRLEQNYPNPFNPTTVISYTLPIAGNVELTVYNMAGEKVTDLVNGFLDAGSHSVDFNAAGLASGIYIYRLKAGKSIDTKKMVLVK